MRPLADGSGTERDAIESYRHRHGKDPKSMPKAQIEPPVSVMYLYRAFWEIAQGRQIVGMSGTMLPLPPSEILAWSTLTATRLRGWELEAIQLLDRAYLTSASQK